MEETISLQEIFHVIKKRLLLIITCTILAALIAAVVSLFVLTPIYQSSTQFIVNQSTTQQDQQMPQVDSGTIRTNVELINTYNVIITSNAILNDVVTDLNLAYSAETLASKIQVSSEQNSQVVTVTVKDPNPEQATKIANTTVAIFQDKIVDIMNVDNVKVISEAVTKASPSPVEPKPTLNIAIAIVLGLMVGVGIAFLIEYLDTTIRTEADVEKVLELPVLATISTVGTKDMKIDQADKIQNDSEGGFRSVQTKN